MSTLDQSQTTSHAQVWQGLYSTFKVAQTFQAGTTAQLVEVHVWAKGFTPSDNLIIEIRDTVSGHPGINILSSNEIAIADVPNNGELTIILTTPVNQVSGTKYAIVAYQKNNAGDGSHYYYLYGDNTHNYYANGSLYDTSTSTWSIESNVDLWFETFIVTPTQQTILSDAVIKHVIQQTINSDAKIKVTDLQQTILSDAVITHSFLQTIDSDASIFVSGKQATILSDAEIIRRIQTNISSDANIKVTGTQQTITSDAVIEAPILYDINNLIKFSKGITDDITNYFTFVINSLSNVFNKIVYCKSIINDIANDIRTQKLTVQDCLNDVRFTFASIVPGPTLLATGPQSLGKSYLHLYIDGIEQTDAVIDTGRIGKGLNSSHAFSFDLGRAYDASAPSTESVVTIYYNSYLLYRGYITEVSASEQPENITVTCKDKYFEGDEHNKYFFVGNQPYNSLDLYYENIYDALTIAYGIVFDIGHFIPETLKLWGTKVSEGIGQLIETCGNYSWFYDENETPRLWTGGDGRIVTIDRQELNKNIGLCDLLNHRLTEDVEEVVNQYIVIMGALANSNEQTYQGYNLGRYFQFATPAWNPSYEILAKDSVTGEGWDYHNPEDEDLYKDVYRVWNLPFLNSSLETWTDEQPPSVVIYYPGNNEYVWGIPEGAQPYLQIKEGFTIDYKNGLIVFQEPQYFERLSVDGETSQTIAPIIQVFIWKKQYYTFTLTKTENPEVESNNPLRFITNKVGDYPETLFEVLELPQLSYQPSITGAFFNFPGWDDRAYAQDYAYWQLSKTAEPKIKGEIQLTLDAVCFYNIDLSCRIFINGITTSPLNITEMNYDLSNFVVTLSVENFLPYKRTVSISKHSSLGGL